MAAPVHDERAGEVGLPKLLEQRLHCGFVGVRVDQAVVVAGQGGLEVLDVGDRRGEFVGGAGRGRHGDADEAAPKCHRAHGIRCGRGWGGGSAAAAPACCCTTQLTASR